MRKKRLFLILIGMLTVIILAVGCGMSAEETLNKADNTADPNERIKILSELIEKKPDLVEAYIKRARAYEELKDYDNELADGNKAVELAADNPEAYLCRGIAYHNKKQYEKALEDFNQSITLKSDYAEAYRERGRNYIGMNKLDLAMEDCNKAISLAPDYAEAYYTRGNVYLRRNDYQKALEEFNKTVELKPDYALVYNNRGNVYAEMGNNELAIKDYETDISLNPRDPLPHYNLGRLYSITGDIDKAFVELNAAIELEPNLSDTYVQRGVIYNNYIHDYERAIKEHDKAIELKPTPLAYINRSISYRMLGDLDKALADAEKALELDATYIDAQKEKQILESLIRASNAPTSSAAQPSGSANSDTSNVYSREPRKAANNNGGPGEWGCAVCGTKMEVNDVSVDPHTIDGAAGDCVNFITQRSTGRPHQWIRLW